VRRDKIRGINPETHELLFEGRMHCVNKDAEGTYGEPESESTAPSSRTDGVGPEYSDRSQNSSAVNVPVGVKSHSVSMRVFPEPRTFQ